MSSKTLFPTSVTKLLPEHLNPSKALREGHFVPFFQPLVTLRTGQLAGFEMLARWQHPEEGMISPELFIAVAEQDGWIEELTRQLLQAAFAAAVAIPDPLTLSINISPLQLGEAGLPARIRDLAAVADFPLSRLVIEITESALIVNLESAAGVVAELKTMGCRLSLDDFGTGYSSLTHLQALPFDNLKVDRSFVGSMIEKRESRKIVSAVVGLGQSLGLKTVAEGIETHEQAEMLLWLGCDLGQGYFYGRPLPAEGLQACVSAKRAKLLFHSGSAWKKISVAHSDASPTQRLAQLQAVYDGAPVGLALIDRNLRYVNLNQRLADMNGAKVEDLLGSSVAEMIPELFPYIESYLRRALAGEALTDIEVPLPKTEATRLLSYLPVRDEANEVIGVSLTVADISERKRMEEALRISEAHYRNMVELNPQVLWVMDPEGRNLEVSPRWDKATGLLTPHSTEHEWLRSVHPEDIQPTFRAIAESRREGSGIDVQYRVSGEKGSWLWKRSRGAPRFDEAGKIVCWYGSVEEIDDPRASRKTLAPRAFSEGVSSLTSAEMERRAQAIDELDILDTPPEQEFDDLVALAAEICETPISLISLIDTERQWFKAAVGFAASETPIATSFCTHTISQEELFVVTDATRDVRFKDKALVVGSPHIRFYAGMPIYAGDVPIGALCVIDTVPRALAPSQVKALTILSHQVQARIELRCSRNKAARNMRGGGALPKPIETNGNDLKQICPQCHNTSSRDSRVRFYDLPLFLTGMIPMRCVCCQHRYYRHRLAAPMPGRNLLKA